MGKNNRFSLNIMFKIDVIGTIYANIEAGKLSEKMSGEAIVNENHEKQT
jgi:hypothetical protein